MSRVNEISERKPEPRVTPRLIRFKDAPRYLGMDRHCFNREVRPHMAEIRIGKQGIAFDRVDLDAWVLTQKEIAFPTGCKTGQTSFAVPDDTKIKTKKSLKPCKKPTLTASDFTRFADTLLKKSKSD